MFHANDLNLGKYDYKIIPGNSSEMSQSETSDCSPDFRTKKDYNRLRLILCSLILLNKVEREMPNSRADLS
jgi:hypothetical protein